MTVGGAGEDLPQRIARHVIVTPIWEPLPPELAIALLEHSYTVNAQIPVVFIGPEGLDLGFYRERFPQAEWLPFPRENFESVTAYSTWMTTPDLYDALSAFEIMTMCQQDAILLRPVTEIPMDEVDYLGAPWDPPVRVLRIGSRISVASSAGGKQGPWYTHAFGRRLIVGNGGLSTRRISAMADAARTLGTRYPNSVRHGLLEDVYYCALGPEVGLRVASKDLAERTFAESTARHYPNVGSLVGLHGAQKWNPELLTEILGS